MVPFIAEQKRLVVVDVRTRMPGYEDHKKSVRNSLVTGIVIHHSEFINRHTGQPKEGGEFLLHLHGDLLKHHRGGYHYVIRRNGLIEQILGEQIPTQHTTVIAPDAPEAPESEQTLNDGLIDICLLGWFENDRPYVDIFGRTHVSPNRCTHPSPAQIQSLLLLAQDICNRYAIPVGSVRGHCELEGADTGCPGSNVDLELLRNRLHQQVENSHPPRRILRQSRPQLRIKERVNRLLFAIGRVSLLVTPLAVGISFIFAWMMPPVPVIWLIRVVLLLGVIAALPILRLRWVIPKNPARIRPVRQANPTSPIQWNWVDFHQVPAHLYQAILVSEDVHFFEHAGFNWLEMYRAIRAALWGAHLRGASTITQQVVRNIFLWPDQSFLRKALEAVLTIYVESLIPKQRIFELYVNIVQFGKDVFGVGAAASTYFHRDVSTLTPEEGALLVAVMPNPLLLSVDKPTEQVIARRDEILDTVIRYQGSFSAKLPEQKKASI